MDTLAYVEVNEISVAYEGGAMTAIEVVEESGMMELDEESLSLVSGCGGHQSNSHFNRRRAETKGSTFAGPEGAGSTFSHKEEEISSGSSDFSWD